MLGLLIIVSQAFVHRDERRLEEAGHGFSGPLNVSSAVSQAARYQEQKAYLRRNINVDGAAEVLFYRLG